MEEEIKNYLKQSLLSLMPRQHRARSSHPRSRIAPVPSITRLKAGMPQAVSTPARHVPRRRRSPHVAYTHGSYLSRPRRDSGISQPLFRIS